MAKESAGRGCIFCEIVRGGVDAPRVFEDERTLAFLDHRPLFPGHVLLVPREHHVTLMDLPEGEIPALFGNAKRLARAVEEALRADGVFVAMNNRISQSVPHLHVHIIPRRKGDGLKGFFWPRHGYKDDAEREAVRAAIEDAVRRA